MVGLYIAEWIGLDHGRQVESSANGILKRHGSVSRYVITSMTVNYLNKSYVGHGCSLMGVLKCK